MKKIIFAAIGLALLLMATAFALYYYYRQPVSQPPGADQEFIIEPGQGLNQIAASLEATGLIRSQYLFRFDVSQINPAPSFDPGIFTLNTSMTTKQIIATLQTEATEVTITILPGWRREEIAEYLSSLSLENFDNQEFLQLTADLEGQLMPETYRIFPDATASEITDLLHQQFITDIQENPDIQAQVAASDYSFEEILTLASLLQREARDPEQMRQIAAILYSRLEDNYPLQLCATAQYATGADVQSGEWWEPPTLEDTEYDSPYNTYQYKGLPPGPVSSISLPAIEAALNPGENDYYFYLHDPQGNIHYATTVEEHDQNKQYL